MGIHRLLNWLSLHLVSEMDPDRELSDMVTKDKPLLVVDATAWALYISCVAHSRMDALCGGQWKEVYAETERAVQQLTGAGAQLVFIFDSVRPAEKVSTLKARRWTSSTRAWMALQSCVDANHCNYWAHQEMLSVLQETGRRPGDLRVQWDVETVAAALMDMQSRYGIEVFECLAGTDGDVAIADYCRLHKDRVAALVTCDGDFLLLPHGCPVVTWKMGAPKDGRACLQILAITETRFVPELCGGVHHVPLLAALAGTDYSKCFFGYRGMPVWHPERFECLRNLLNRLCSDPDVAISDRDEAYCRLELRKAADGLSETEAVEDAEEAVTVASAPDRGWLGPVYKDAPSSSHVTSQPTEDTGGGVGSGAGTEAVEAMTARVLQRFADRIASPTQRAVFLEEARSAVAFFTAPAVAGATLRPYTACQPVPDGHWLVTSSEIGDDCLCGGHFIARVLLCLEYAKHRMVHGAPADPPPVANPSPAAVQTHDANVEPRLTLTAGCNPSRISAADNLNPGPNNTTTHTHTHDSAACGIPPLRYELLRPRKAKKWTPDSVPQFVNNTINLPDDVSDLARHLQMGLPPATALCRLLSASDALPSLTSVSELDRLFLMAVQAMLSHDVLSTTDVWLVLVHHAFCCAGAALSHRRAADCLSRSANYHLRLHDTAPSTATATSTAPAPASEAALSSVSADDPELSHDSISDRPCRNLLNHCHNDPNGNDNASAFSSTSSHGLAALVIRGLSPDLRLSALCRFLANKGLSPATAFTESHNGRKGMPGRVQFWLQFSDRSRAAVAKERLDRHLSQTVSCVYRPRVQLMSPFAGCDTLQPCAAGVVLGKSVQTTLQAVFQINYVLNAFPSVGYRPWLWYDGVTFQALHLDLQMILHTFGTPDIVRHAQELHTVLQEHTPGGAFLQEHMHKCWVQWKMEPLK